MDRTGGSFKYTKAFQEIVGHCLEKDPAKRPTAAELLASPFFRTVKKESYLVGTVLSEGLLPLLEIRFRLPIINQPSLEELPPLTQRQERRKRPSSTFYNTLSSWDFSSTLSVSVKRPLSISRNSLPHPDDVPRAADSVFELDEDQANGKSEGSSSGPPTPGPATPVLAGVSSPPKDELANRALSVSPEDGPKSDLDYDPPNATPIPTRVTHTMSTRSAPETPTDLDDAPVGGPYSASSDKTLHGSKLWNKLAKPGLSRSKKLNAALDKTGTFARVVSSGFSGKSHKS